MNRPIKVGFLSPFSTIYPSLGQDMTDGIMCGLPEKLHGYFEFIPVFIGQGEPNAIEPALQKLLAFDRVDLVTGFVGYRSMTRFVEFFERYDTVALFADMGEYLPFDENQSNHLFFNSFQLWQAEYALGVWAQQEFKGKGSIFMPLYESGYHMHSSFRYGIAAAENVPVDLAMIPYMNSQKYSITASLMEYIEKFRKERPSYLHVLFSGKEAQEFLSVFHREGLHREIPLIVSPLMASFEVLHQLRNLDMTFYSASLWNIDSEDTANKTFKNAYIQRTGLLPSVFSLLGYEVGLALEMIFPALEKRLPDEAKKTLKEATMKTPRGERGVCAYANTTTPIIDIEKVRIANNSIQKMTVAQGHAMPHNHQVFESIQRENVTGWLNAYLCV